MSKRFLTGLLCAAVLAGGCSGSYTTTSGSLDTASNTTLARTADTPAPAPPVVEAPVAGTAFGDSSAVLEYSAWSDFGETPASAAPVALDQTADYSAWSDFGETPAAAAPVAVDEESASYAMQFEQAGAAMGDRYAAWSDFGESPAASRARFANWSDFGESPSARQIRYANWSEFGESPAL